MRSIRCCFRIHQRLFFSKSDLVDFVQEAKHLSTCTCCQSSRRSGKSHASERSSSRATRRSHRKTRHQHASWHCWRPPSNPRYLKISNSSQIISHPLTPKPTKFNKHFKGRILAGKRCCAVSCASGREVGCRVSGGLQVHPIATTRRDGKRR